jgi:dihydropteroate synthase
MFLFIYYFRHVKKELMKEKTRLINAGGILIDLSIPRIMGILNVTPDSFYSGSRFPADRDIIQAAVRMKEEGADIIDIGGYSSRPGADDIPEEEEARRLFNAVRLVTRELHDVVISVDTFRSGIAREAVEKYGAGMVNDISGGEADPAMFDVIEHLNVPYVLMHMKGVPRTMQDKPVYDDVVADILKWFGKKIVRLHSAGVKDIIIDPGFGFGKTVEHNFEILQRFDEFSVAGLPVLAGLSRKSMISKTLAVSADEALNGTTALNMAALMGGADILRVHDVKEAVQVVKLYTALMK